MRNLYFNIICAFLLSPCLASAATFGDGCYQFYKPNTVYPVMCVSGSMEEGIGGANAMVAIFGSNTNKVIWCGKTTSIVNNADAFEVQYNFASTTGMRKIKLAGRYNDPWETSIVGTVSIDEVDVDSPYTLEFFQIVGDNLKPLKGWQQQELCRDL